MSGAQESDEGRVLGPAAGEDDMHDGGGGARVCLEMGRGGQGGRGGRGRGGGGGGGCGGVGELMEESGDADIDMERLCDEMVKLEAPSKIHFGRRREAGLCLSV